VRINRFKIAGTSTHSRWSAFVAASLAIMIAAHTIAQAPAAVGAAVPPRSAEELDKLVGPIALYPDDLVAIVLPAATNPLQLVQADRFLEKRKTDSKLPVNEKWDDAVKSLLNYPDIVKMMSSDLDWTTALGEAVADDQGAVLDAIQSFRRKTQSAGNLKTDTKQVIVVEKEVIRIVPADPQVIYVPQYNPVTVVVYSAVPVYGYWPVAYPSYYYPYPPGAAFATGVIWGAAMGAAWHGGYYGTNWGGSNNNSNNNITINRNANINTGNINTGNINRGNVNGNRSGQASTLPANTSAWKPNKTSSQVSGTAASSARAGQARTGGASSASSAGSATRPSTPQSGATAGTGAGTAAAARTSVGTPSASARTAPGAASASRSGTTGGDAFSSYGSGRQTQMDSSRGSASRTSMSGGTARQTPSGGTGARQTPSGSTSGARQTPGGGGGRR
jgi:hypothetical protein